MNHLMQEDQVWAITRHGQFIGNEFRIPVTLALISPVRSVTGGVHSWNEEIGDYIRITKNDKFWPTVCQMKS